MSFKPLVRFPPLRALLYRLARWRVAEKLLHLTPLLRSGDVILDVGAGNCVLCEALLQRGHQVTPLDLRDLSFVAAVRPVLYDGTNLPFPPGRFDVALLVTVLHHAHDPDLLVAEAGRVAARVVIVEEIYSGRVRKYLTYLVDSLFNLEFFGHPRNNRTDAGWRASFDALGLRVVSADYSTSLGVLERVTYCLGR
jgi:SAM-dependent methyltransferase